MPITVVRTRGLSSDFDGDGQADPGDIFSHEIIVTNTDAVNRFNLVDTETENGLTINPASVKIGPIAVNDAFNFTGNTPITFTAAQLLGNDLDPDDATPNLTITNLTTGTNGTIVDNGNGTYTFTPTTGLDVGQTATFSYSIEDADGVDSVAATPGLVTLTVTDVVWYVDQAYSGVNGASDGSYLRPFTALTQLNGLTGDGTTNDDVDAAGETIFIYDRGTSAYNAGITLENSQQLRGDQGTFMVNGLTVGATANNSTINHSGTGIILGSGNTIHGLDLVGTAGTAAGITDNGASAGNLTITSTNITGQGQIIDIDNGGTFVLGSSLGTLGSTGSTGANGGVIDLTGVGGTLSVTGTTSINGTHGQAGINISGVTSGNITFQGNLTLDTGAQTAINITGNSGLNALFSGASKNIDTTSATAINLTGNSTTVGSIRFTNGGLDVDTTTGTGLNVSGSQFEISGTNNDINTTTGQIMTVANSTLIFSSLNFDALGASGTVTGTAIDLNNLDGANFDAATVSIAGATGDGVRVVGGSNVNVDFDSVTINATGDGIESNASTGLLRVSAGSVTSTGTGDGVNITGGTGVVEFSATVTKSGTGGNVVEVNDHETGTITFFSNADLTATGGGNNGILVTNVNSGHVEFAGDSMAINTGASNGVNLTSNTGSTINFNSGPGGTGLDITTTTGTGFNATGGGTVTVTNNSGNTIDSTSATALNVVNTTIGSGGLNFTAISAGNNTAAADPTHGIVLNNTGALGGLAVTGTGTANSGGTIQNISQYGISLTSTLNPSFNNININNIGRNGIDGFDVTNFSLTNSSITTVGTASLAGDFETSAIAFVDRSGANDNTIDGNITITGNTISDPERNGIMIETWAGTISNINISNNTLSGGTTNARIQDAVHVFAMGTTGGITTGTINNNSISDFRFFDTAPAIDIFIGGNGIRLVTDTNAVNSASTLGTIANPFVISGNDIDNVGSNMIAVTAVGRTASANVRILNNGTIADPMTNAEGLGISVFFGGNGTFNGLVHNNVIDNIDQGANPSGSSGIGVQSDFGGDNGANTDVTNSNFTISNNTISDMAGNGIIATGINNAGTMNVRIIDNDVLTIPDLAARFGIRVGHSNVGTQPTINLEIHGNDTAGGNPIIGPPDGIGIRQQSGFTFGIEGLTPSPATGAQAATYINGQNPGETTTILSGNNFTAANVPDSPAPMMASTPPALEPEPPATSPPVPGPTEVVTQPPAPPSPPENGGTPTTEPAPPTPPSHPVIVNDGFLSQAELDYLVEAAIQRWIDAGATPEQVAEMRATAISVADMAGLYLGSSDANSILIDSDGAGHGWFLDRTPGDDAEYDGAGTRLTADAGGPADGRMDLLTVLMHELGHQVGLDDIYSPNAVDELMYGYANIGERRLPQADDLVGADMSHAGHESFVLSPIIIGTLPDGKAVRILFESTVNDFANQVIPGFNNTSTISFTGGGPVTSAPEALVVDSLTLGGTIWNDNGAGVGGIGGNGIKDGTEAGIVGVALSLFADANNDNVADTPGTSLATTLTIAGGNYSFANLAEGNYIVRVDQDNFDAGGNTSLVATPLSPITSPEPIEPDNNVDNDDNGARADGQPAFSNAISLNYNQEPTPGTGNDTNNTLDFGFFANTPPVIGNLGGDNSTFTEGGPAVAIDVAGPSATVTDTQTHLSGGSLTVSISANEVAAEDVLGISTAGTVTLSAGTNVGSIVSVGGLAIGTITANGSGGNDLAIAFNTNDATPAAITTLVRALTYANTNTTDPSTLTRTVSVTVVDGLGGINSDSENVTVTVVGVNDEPTLVATGNNPTYLGRCRGGRPVQRRHRLDDRGRPDADLADPDGLQRHRRRRRDPQDRRLRRRPHQRQQRRHGDQHSDRERQCRRQPRDNQLHRRDAERGGAAGPGRRARLSQFEPGPDRRRPRRHHHPAGRFRAPTPRRTTMRPAWASPRRSTSTRSTMRPAARTTR